MEKKTLLKHLVILLCFSYVVYAAAVPATRGPKTRNIDPSVQDHQAKEDLVMDLSNWEELFEVKEGLEEGRMMMDIADYPPTGANGSHTPKSPRKP